MFCASLRSLRLLLSRSYACLLVRAPQILLSIKVQQNRRGLVWVDSVVVPSLNVTTSRSVFLCFSSLLPRHRDVLLFSSSFSPPPLYISQSPNLVISPHPKRSIRVWHGIRKSTLYCPASPHAKPSRDELRLVGAAGQVARRAVITGPSHLFRKRGPPTRCSAPACSPTPPSASAAGSRPGAPTAARGPSRRRGRWRRPPP